MFSSTLILAVLAGALGLALYGIGSTVSQHWNDICDALAGRPRLFASDEPDRWRTVHRRADRRRAFAPADPARRAADRSERS